MAAPESAEAMAIAAETQDLLLSLRQTDASKRDEVRSKKELLLQKLRAKKEAAKEPRNEHLSSCKPSMMIPVARATAHPLLHGKKRMLGQIRKTALVQGAESMAKMFGYKNYQEQQLHLKKEEEARIIFNEAKKKQEELNAKKPPSDEEEVSDEEDVDMENEEKLIGETNNDVERNVDEAVDTGLAYSADDSAETTVAESIAADKDSDVPNSTTDNDVAMADTDADTEVISSESQVDSNVQDVVAVENTEAAKNENLGSPSNPRRQVKRITVLSDDEDGDADHSDIEDSEAQEAAARRAKDKAANYRALLAEEESHTRRRRRLGQGMALVESEAEEEEEQDVLNIGGLGDFGFGVPLASTEADKEREEEANALKIREDDLEHIVDELSDDEKDKNADEAFREHMEARDRQQVSEVMRNVREGFGRNRRIFSTGLNNGEARGRFNLNELVAADGSKAEAARLGLLESDEEVGEEEKHEEDEEERMEKELRERFMNQPQVYITSSESESEDEEPTNEAEVAVDEGLSDEEREARQMKIFSAKAKINRRMQRMNQLQKAQSEELGTAKSLSLPLLDEDMEESQELVKGLRQCMPVAPPTLRKRTSYSLTSTSSSFSRIADTCKLFTSNSTSKAFVFTNSLTESAPDTLNEPTEKENHLQNTERKRPLDHDSLKVAKKLKKSNPRAAKPKSALLTALSSYQCDTTALHRAAENGHKDIVSILLKAQANLNVRNSYFFGRCPIHLAAINGHKEIVALLISAGANINHRAKVFRSISSLMNVFRM
ncbi:cleavage induced hypothetical protein, partial [Thraustotheca clavata]